MIRPFTFITLLAAAGSGLYLYQVKHAVSLLDRELRDVNRQTEQARERTQVLRAEWALLNEPERLRSVAQRHLSLEPMTPGQFVRPGELARRLPQAVAFAGAPSLFAPPVAPAAATRELALASAPSDGVLGTPVPAQIPAVMAVAAAAPMQAPAPRPAAEPRPATETRAPAEARPATEQRPVPEARTVAAARPVAPAPIRPALHVEPQPVRTAAAPPPPPRAPVATPVAMPVGSSLGSAFGAGRPALPPPIPIAPAR